ncbi:hypothetical protein V1478_000382 [Vespula squamosa]|uniref:Uncharacterized protein n=1 Tax=Vespula squamosa TaxID=30214 RepID=A0ABD2C5C3_VESSQ
MCDSALPLVSSPSCDSSVCISVLSAVATFIGALFVHVAVICLPYIQKHFTKLEWDHVQIPYYKGIACVAILII